MAYINNTSGQNNLVKRQNALDVTSNPDEQKQSYTNVAGNTIRKILDANKNNGAGIAAQTNAMTGAIDKAVGGETKRIQDTAAADANKFKNDYKPFNISAQDVNQAGLGDTTATNKVYQSLDNQAPTFEDKKYTFGGINPTSLQSEAQEPFKGLGNAYSSGMGALDRAFFEQQGGQAQTDMYRAQKAQEAMDLGAKQTADYAALQNKTIADVNASKAQTKTLLQQAIDSAKQQGLKSAGQQKATQFKQLTEEMNTLKANAAAKGVDVTKDPAYAQLESIRNKISVDPLQFNRGLNQDQAAQMNRLYGFLGAPDVVQTAMDPNAAGIASARNVIQGLIDNAPVKAPVVAPVIKAAPQPRDMTQPELLRANNPNYGQGGEPVFSLPEAFFGQKTRKFNDSKEGPTREKSSSSREKTSNREQRSKN